LIVEQRLIVEEHKLVDVVDRLPPLSLQYLQAEISLRPEVVMAVKTRTRRAYSYARFSTTVQAGGFSLERQLEAAKRYCTENGLALDEECFSDEGVSGFKGANATVGALSRFIGLVREGRIPAGSVLIVENVDRISRLPVHEAMDLVRKIVGLGIELVILSPRSVINQANVNHRATWLPVQISQDLANEESVKKSERCADAWSRKRKALAEGAPITCRCPAWLRMKTEEIITYGRTAKAYLGWEQIPDRVEAVRLAFRLCCEGKGVKQITTGLQAAYPNGLTGKGWQPAQVARLLRNRSVLGEYQPHTGTAAKPGIKSTRKPHGDPIKDYFPAIIDEATFYRVQDAMTFRHSGGGRKPTSLDVTSSSRVANLFNGITFDAADGHTMILSDSSGHASLYNSGALRKVEGANSRLIRYSLFERAILSFLSELKPKDVLGHKVKSEEEVEALSGRLTAVAHKHEWATRRALEADDPDTYGDLLEALAAEKRALSEQLETAKAKAASQTGDNLGECISLIALLEGTDNGERDDLRSKARAAIRRLVESIYVLVVPRGQSRLIAVQLYFRGGGRRDYLLYYRQAGRGRKLIFKVCSVRDDPNTFPLPMHHGSLRDPNEVDEVRCTLESLLEDRFNSLSLFFSAYPDRT
jgi:DNA invertase Pin-like site-specific DNA recombinase